MATRPKKTPNNEAFLKEKVRTLEDQVCHYKQRLDELRKAKNTTILKREREVLEVGAPNLGRRISRTEDDESHSEMREKIKAELNRQHQDEIDRLKQSSGSGSCDHEAELQRMRRTVDSLESENTVFVMENSDLKEQVECLLQELSIKEAHWCETEEQLNAKLKLQWGEKYAEWMQHTEQKLEELQQANNLMRTLLKKKKPGDPDPSHQDPSSS